MFYEFKKSYRKVWRIHRKYVKLKAVLKSKINSYNETGGGYYLQNHWRGIMFKSFHGLNKRKGEWCVIQTL